MEPRWKRALTSWQMGLVGLVGTVAWLFGIPSPSELIDGVLWDTWIAILPREWNGSMVSLILLLFGPVLLGIHIGFVLASGGKPYRGLWTRLKSATQKPTQVPRIDDIMYAFGVPSMNQMTHQQAEDANAQWAGKSMQISGKVFTILSTVPSSISGTAAKNLMCVQLSSKEVSGFDVLFQPDPWKEILKKVNRGDSLTMSATIDKIHTNGNMRLKDGAIVEHTRPRPRWSGRG